MFLGINLLSLPLIPAKVVICFPTVFCNFILTTIAIPDRFFAFI